jgi:hypothetical protein
MSERILEKYKLAAIRAHNWTSFSPEKRGEQMIQDYSEQLTEDLVRVREMNGDAQAYQAKYESLFSAWLSAKSRCASTMITGGSGFNVRRNDKANASERNKYEAFSGWRDWYFKRLAKNIRREERANSDPLADMREKLESAVKLQALMVECNKIIRSKKTDVEKHDLLVQAGLSESAAIEVMKPGRFGGMGFASFQLTNNNANIKRMQMRVSELEKKASAETKSVERADGIEIVENAEADRLQIFFPGKPEPEMIAKLKHNAFKWSPKNGCWQRQLTANALASLRRVLPS